MATDSWQSVRDFAKSVLGTFVEERTQRFPDKPELLPFLRLGRAHLAIVHDQCEAFLRLLEGKETGPFFGCVCAALQRSPVRQAQRFFCVLQMIHAHSEYLRGPSQQTAWFYLVTEGACDIYGQSYDLFLRLQDEEQAWQGRDPATVVGERSLRFAACALLDVCRECQCAPPLPDVVIATVRVMDELVNGKISQLDESGVLNTGQWLIANGWSRPGTEAVAGGGRKASSDHRIGASSMADLSYGEWRVIWLGGMLVIGAIGAASAGEGPIAVLVMLGGAALIFFLIRRRLR